jgi:hypothetical protein
MEVFMNRKPAVGVSIIAEMVGIILVMTLISGTLLWLFWPVAIPAMFPGLVTSGTLAASLTWWQSVAAAWIFSILVKPSAIKLSNK